MIGLLKERKHRKRAATFFATNERYRLLQQLGEGSYGVAYLLYDHHTKQQVVLKRLKGKHLHTAGYAKFQQEIQFLTQLQHLPVPTLFAQGIIDQAPYYLMSYANGQTFEQAIFLQNKKFPIEATIQYATKLLGIVQNMHATGIVHRDLRIPNILLKENELTIIDFGLASLIDDHINITQIKDPKKIPHPISDLYAIGHFMLFLLYSTFEPTTKKGTTWQQELALPAQLQDYIERLLTIKPPFMSSTEALEALNQLQTDLQQLIG